jgi:hypothetical protein
MRGIMKLFSFVGSLLDRLCMVAGAFLGSQVPQFMQQYTQRLAGHVESLQALLTQLRQMASMSHKTLEEYIQKFRDSADPDFARQADFMHGILTRWQDLHQAYEQLTQGSVVLRPLYFLKNFQTDIAHTTLDSFQPGFSFTLEGLSYAGVGMILGWIVYQIIAKCFAFGYARGWAIVKQSV